MREPAGRERTLPPGWASPRREGIGLELARPSRPATNTVH